MRVVNAARHPLTFRQSPPDEAAPTARSTARPVAFRWADLTAVLAQTRARVFGAAALLMLAIAVIDLRTVRELRIGFFYLAPVTFVAWYAGKRAGLVVAAVSATLTLATDVLQSGATEINTVYIVWNSVIRLSVFVVVVSYQSSLKDALEQERQLARHDPLTDAANLRMFREELEHELARCKRYPHPFTVALVDLDDFKRVNDTHGHEAGDAVLRFVADQMRNAIRGTDTCARLGGDEFGLLLPETSHRAARQALEKIQHRLRTAPSPTSPRVTVSIGAVTYTEPPNSVDEIVGRADYLMYTVKRRTGKGGIAAVSAEPAAPLNLDALNLRKAPAPRDVPLISTDRRNSNDRRRVPRGGRRPLDVAGRYPPVLVVDSDDERRQASERYLDGLGFQVEAVATKDAALGLVDVLKPHVAIAALPLARDEALRACLRKQGIPYIVTSATGNSAAPGDAASVLGTPMAMPDLVREVRRALRSANRMPAA